MQSGQGKEGPNNLLRLGTERALSLLPVVGRLIMSQPIG